jgi:hypothetical protein
MQMKALIVLASTAIMATAAATPAQAREGCGPGFHRAWNGMCRANRGTEMRRMEGRYYAGQGYWHSGRYWRNRHRRHGVWIYM